MRALLVLLILLGACHDVHNTYYGIEGAPPARDAAIESSSLGDAAAGSAVSTDGATVHLNDPDAATVNPQQDAAVEDAEVTPASTFASGYRVTREMTETCDHPSKLTEMFWDVRTDGGEVFITARLTDAGGQLLYTELTGDIPTEVFTLTGSLADSPLLSVTITGGFTTPEGGFEAEEKSGPVSQTVCDGWVTRKLIGVPF